MFLHSGFVHLAVNMLSLYFLGSFIEQAFGRGRFLALYLLSGISGGLAYLYFGAFDAAVVGASGAIFGLFGLLLAAGRLHHPVDRQSRSIVGQLGMIILLNLILGFAWGGRIDNAAHIGGLVAGLWLGAIIPPTRISTLSSIWQRAGTDGMDRVARPPAAVPVLAVVAVAGAVVVGLVYGTSVRETGRSGIDPVPIAVVHRAALPPSDPPAGGPVPD